MVKSEVNDSNGAALIAAISTFHTDGKDMLYAMSQLLLVCIGRDQSIDDIRAEFESWYKLKDVPSDVIRTMIRRLRSEKLISYKNIKSVNTKSINITDIGRERKERLIQSSSALSRELQDLIKDMMAFLKGNNYSIPQNPSRALILFIDQNMSFTSSTLTQMSNHKLKVDSGIAKYILHIERSDAKRFAFLQNMFFGRLYLSIMRVRSEFSKNIKFDDLRVFLDTNILLSSLGLHGEEAEVQAKDLLSLISKNNKAKTVVALDTVDEAKRLLNNAIGQISNYYAKVPVDSIYYQLRSKGYDVNKINLLIETLDDKIDEMGISVINIDVDQESKKYQDLSDNISVWARLFKRPKRPSTLAHDAAVMTYVSNERRGLKTKVIEKSRAIFVSPDTAVISVSKERARKYASFPLAITPIELISLLWIRDSGSKDIATSVMRQSIMAYVRERAISHSLWDKFICELGKAVDDRILSEEDVGIILASSETFEILADDEKDAPKRIINQEFIDKIHSDQREKSRISEKRALKIESVINRIKMISHKIATIISVTIGLLILISLAALFVWLVSFTGLESAVSIIPVGAFFITSLILLFTGNKIEFLNLLYKLRKYIYKKVKLVVEDRLKTTFGLNE